MFIIPYLWNSCEVKSPFSIIFVLILLTSSYVEVFRATRAMATSLMETLRHERCQKYDFIIKYISF